MRRRPPNLVELTDSEVAFLHGLVRDGRTEQRVARRARVLLALRDPAVVVQDLALRFEQSCFAVWDLRRRFGERGVQAVFDAPRSGRPTTLSPSGAGRDRAVGLLRPGRHWPGDHALEHA